MMSLSLVPRTTPADPAQETAPLPDPHVFVTAFSEARNYHICALRFDREAWRPSLVFNVAALALERYLIALCGLYGEMPMNHNFRSLVCDTEAVVTIPPALAEDLRGLDRMFGICSLDSFHIEPPTDDDALQTLRMCNDVLALFDRQRVAAMAGSAMAGQLLAPDPGEAT